MNAHLIRRTEKRMTLVSGVSAVTGADEMGRDLLYARENFATLFQGSPAILCIIELNSLRYREINEAYEQRTGYRRHEVLGQDSLKLGLWSTVEDRDSIFRELDAQGRVHRHQKVFQTKTGEPLTTILSAEIIQFDGRQCALVVAEDISSLQRAEEARLDLAQRLIGGQEVESKRVGQELHDSIGQSVAMLSMDLERTRLSLTDRSADTDARLAILSGKLKDLGTEVANLSHRLHSSKLELLGLAVAVRSLVREFSEQYQVRAGCSCSAVPDDLSGEMSLCFFRVMQEALHNIAKHSRATTIDIELDGSSGFLRLNIADDGVGFVQNGARAGLGLISMRERVHLIGGTLLITSKPGSGTRVEAIVSIAKASPGIVQTRCSRWLDEYQAFHMPRLVDDCSDFDDQEVVPQMAVVDRT
jgi:PAS domain S-box-containing protein